MAKDKTLSSPSHSKWMHQVQAPELATMLIMSFRYALGRKSTAPSTVQSLLSSYGHALEPWQATQIVKDIEHAIASGLAGMDCDVVTWKEVARRLCQPPKGTKEIK